MTDPTTPDGGPRLLTVRPRAGGEAAWAAPGDRPLPRFVGNWPTSPTWKAPSHWARDIVTAACLVLVLAVLGSLYVDGLLVDGSHGHQPAGASTDPFAITAGGGN